MDFIKLFSDVPVTPDVPPETTGVEFTIVDGKLTALEYSYILDANLKIKLAIPSATGTGQAEITGKYTDIAY